MIYRFFWETGPTSVLVGDTMEKALASIGFSPKSMEIVTKCDEVRLPKYVEAEFLRSNPDVVFVFGDNLLRKGKGGAAKLRDEPNAYGFITKKYPNWKDDSFYRPEEYLPIFREELNKLNRELFDNVGRKVFLITKLGAGLANKYNIYEEVIKPWRECIEMFWPHAILI